MLTILTILQVVLSALLILTILFQTRGSGLGSLAGGSGEAIVSERRGAEKLLFQMTVVIGFGFVVNAFVISAFF